MRILLHLLILSLFHTLFSITLFMCSGWYTLL